jgi:hypothetical protein
LPLRPQGLKKRCRLAHKAADQQSQQQAYLVVQVQEILQACEALAGRAGGGGIWVRQRDAVALGQREHELRLQRALYMQVQFSLGQAGDEGL